MDEIAELAHLELVSRVCTELENHLGINDKTVAEFVIDLTKQNPTFNKLKSALSEQGIDVSCLLLHRENAFIYKRQKRIFIYEFLGK